MALTSSEEDVLKQIIDANGKRLSDLPTVNGTNPYNLFCEVLDEDGESKKPLSHLLCLIWRANVHTVLSSTRLFQALLVLVSVTATSIRHYLFKAV